MQALKPSKNNVLVLNLRDNSEKEAIIQSISSSGKLEIHDADGIITIRIKSPTSHKTYQKPLKGFYVRGCSLHKLSITKGKKHPNILERVAKSQNIALAEPGTLEVACTGVIV